MDNVAKHSIEDIGVAGTKIRVQVKPNHARTGCPGQLSAATRWDGALAQSNDDWQVLLNLTNHLVNQVSQHIVDHDADHTC